MNDTGKTKEELIDEIEGLRKELDRLKAKLDMLEGKPDFDLSEFRNREPREDLSAQIEFVADVDVLNGEGINISESGISFTIEDNLPFEIMFELNGDVYRGTADLAWFQRHKGGCRLGFEYHRD